MIKHKEFDTNHPKQDHQKDPDKEISKKILTGKISINSKGTGYVTLDDGTLKQPKKQIKSDDDIVIEEKDLNTALHGDSVEVSISPDLVRGRKTGKVNRVIARVKEKFVGVIQKQKYGTNENFFLKADDARMYKEIMIKPENLGGAKDGEKVQVELLPWTNPFQNPEGKMIQVLGKKGDNSVEIHSIVLERGFEIAFHPDVEKEAKYIQDSEKPIKDEEIAKRRDFRNTTTFTIDPYDAKDFDDAISYKEIDASTIEVGVHIADVSHYVRPGTALDSEAIKRACSVYLVDRTIPMLPEILSNDLCSLNPNEDKLAFSAVFIVDKNTAEIKSRWFGKTVINSDKRFTYENAQETIDAKNGVFYIELNILNTLAKVMQKAKFLEGAIDFETSEVKFRLDPNGKPLEVYKKERLDTHKLVEEYMLLANREVAEYIFKATKLKKGMVGIYRIHDVPSPEKINDLRLFLKALGHDLPGKGGMISSKDINALLKKINGSPQEALIKTATIRSMAKAIYSPSNLGHFGLAFTYYTHFTSPIRRYPDLMVHRIVQNNIENGKIPQDEYARFKSIADQSSEREIKASEAERASIKMKQVEYMSEYIGKEFEGTISGVTEWGIYVEEVNTRCEGMVKLRDIPGDYYSLDQKNYRVVGTKTKKAYSLGDKVRFKVVGADVEKKTLDYGLVI